MSGSTKLAAYVIAGLLLSVATFMFLVQPALTKLGSLSDEERAAQAEVNRLDSQIRAYKTAQSELAKATNKDLIYSITVDDKNLRVPIEEMESAAKATGTSYDLQINREFLVYPPGTKPGLITEHKKVTAQTELEEVPYTLTVKNQNYGEMVQFFRYLEHIPHFTELSNINISNIVEEEGAAPRLTAIIKGVFLAKKDEAKSK